MTDIDRAREIVSAARPGTRGMPDDCNSFCDYAPCSCSGVAKVYSWKIDIDALREALDLPPMGPTRFSNYRNEMTDND